MLRLLGMLYVVMVMSEKAPKRRAWWKRKRKPITSLLTFAESGVEALPRGPVQKPTASGQMTTPPTTVSSHEEATSGMGFVLTSAPTTPSEPQHRKDPEPIPTSLVEVEALTAIRLQMPNRTTKQGIRLYGNDRFDSPIGRTLTREFIRRDPAHTPKAAIRHLPIMDGVRAMAVHGNVGPQPTSPRAEAKKGRPTPKRNRRTHGTQQ